MKKLVGMFTACLLLAGCGSESEEQIKDKIIVALENEEYEEALTLIEENSLADEETKVLSAQLQEFNEVKEAKSQADWDRVLEKAHSLLENPALDNNLKKELGGMVVEAETEINKSIRESFEQNSANGDEEGNPPPGEPEDPSVSLKEKYLAKLADVEKSVKEFDEIFDQGIQVEMTAAEGEIFSKWDMLLNEIYADLKKTLPPNDMSKLREEQRDWLEYRDEKATEDALQYKGGSMETLQYVSTQAQLTKERCYELVDLYMK
ncbi:lysozyme inhibitor LprI family protein [Solibacillus sp. NPDC093137]|uniref:lysozyme inhibitor LprI family protein n=1 Tax=Solibacillus sp. NPDC093137 TaxID=3390678 RepID=UPI003D064006